MNKFEQPQSENNENVAMDEENFDLEVLKKDLIEELEASTNPNLIGIDYNELTQEDLALWGKYKQYKETGSGLTKDEFLNYRKKIQIANSENETNLSSFKLSAYLVDKLVKLWL